MSNLNLTPQWHDNINQVETGDNILGGANGIANLAPKQLAESLLWLKQRAAEPIQVGDVYTTTVNHTSSTTVNAHHGYGTWARYAEGCTLVGFSTKSSDPAEYKTMGKAFGENEHTLTVDEMPRHNHDLPLSDGSPDDLSFELLSAKPFSHVLVNDGSETADNHLARPADLLTGDDQPHNNIQPSVVVQYWVRTA